jgi:hypothetical protein
MGMTGLFDATGLSDRIGKRGLTLGVLVASAAFGLAVLLLLVRPAFA